MKKDRLNNARLGARLFVRSYYISQILREVNGRLIKSAFETTALGPPARWRSAKGAYQDSE